MVKIEVMDTSAPVRSVRAPSSIIWQSRRLQRLALVGLAFLIIIAVGIYSRNSWPGLTDLEFDKNGLPSYTQPPPSDQAIQYGVSDRPTPQESTMDNPVKHAPKTGESFYTDENQSHEQKEWAKEKPSSNPSKDPIVGTRLDPTRVALIIETRPIPHLPALLLSFIATLPPQWVVKVVGASPVFNLIQNTHALRRHINSGKLNLIILPNDFPTSNNEELSATLTNLSFYRDFLKPAEWLLMFQTDSMICSESATTLDDWVEKGYDWLGAPWHPDVKGGNGGLSLRNVPAIVRLLESETRERMGDWEDLWLCSRLKNAAPADVEMDFSVEILYKERPFGYHLRGSGKLLDAAIWGNRTRKRQILTYCPEIKIVLGNMALESADEEKEKMEDERMSQGGAVKDIGGDMAQSRKPEIEPVTKIEFETINVAQPQSTTPASQGKKVTSAAMKDLKTADPPVSPSATIPSTFAIQTAPSEPSADHYAQVDAVVAESKAMDAAMEAEETSRWSR